MQCVILAAGKGVRMQPLTLKTPKALLTVCGKPILEHMFDLLPSAVSEVILVVGYRGEQIRAYAGARRRGIPVKCVTQTKQLGNYHALAAAAPLLAPGKRFLVLFSDDLFEKNDIARLVEAKGQALLVYEVDDPRRFGVVVPDAHGRVAEIEEKPERPKSRLACCGPAVFTKRIFEYSPPLHAKGEYFIADAVGRMVKDEPVGIVQASFWFPIGYPEDLARAEEVVCKRRHA